MSARPAEVTVPVDRIKVAHKASATIAVVGNPNFGKTFVYHKPFNVGIRLDGLRPDTKTLKLAATYQGCSEND